MALRRLNEDVSTQTTIQMSRPILINDLRNLVRESLNGDDLRLPLRTNANGLTVGDAEDMRNLNETLNGETIRNILESVTENRFDPYMLRNLISKHTGGHFRSY